jgi:hypothetical protein
MNLFEGSGGEIMKIYTYSEARQRFATLLEQARREGAVGVRRRDGQMFVITPEIAKESPLDIAGIHIPVTRDEIVSFVHEGRRTF